MRIRMERRAPKENRSTTTSSPICQSSFSIMVPKCRLWIHTAPDSPRICWLYSQSHRESFHVPLHPGAQLRCASFCFSRTCIACSRMHYQGRQWSLHQVH
jgi:hypothetical protein